jgi:hypothetical protein
VISVLKFFFNFHDIHFPTSPRLRLLVAGLAKTAPEPKRLRRHPLLPDHLLAFLQLNPLTLASLDTCLPFAVLTLALRFGLRPSEVASLLRSKVVRRPDSFLISFQRRKALSFPVWDLDRPMSPCPNDLAPAICPFRVLITYLALRDASPMASSPALFPISTIDPSPISPLNVNSFARSLGDALGLFGIYGHSPRIGSATVLTLLGYSSLEIKVHGNWGKKAYLKYIRNARTWSSATSPAITSFFPPVRA